MRFSENEELFSKTLLSNPSPFDSDYTFFAADLLDSVNNNFKVNILADSPYNNGFTNVIKDLVLEDNVLEIIFETHENYKLVLSKKEIRQVAPAKYHVNCVDANQVINVTFIR